MPPLLPLEPLTPKRLKSDIGTDAIYPYYAGFSSRFAEQALAELMLRKGALVLDPWNGSGTTTTAAGALGLKAAGVDLNPFAGVVATAKLADRDRTIALPDVAVELSAAPHEERADDEDPLRAWLSATLTAYVRGIMNGVALEPGRPTRLRAVLAIALARALRPLATSRTKNPTWNVPSGARFSTRTISKAFREQLAAVRSLLSVGAKVGVQIVTGDARRLPVASNTVNAILTSPPYFTRIDYATKTSFELALLGANSNGALRTSLMGTTALRGERIDKVPSHWPKEVRSLLGRIRDHSSHRSEGYYFPNGVQYFEDACSALGEMSRVLVDQGKALIVVQDSYYKEIHVDLPALFSKMASGLGFRAEIVRRESVRRVMTSVNTASRAYLPKREYTEAVLRLTKERS